MSSDIIIIIIAVIISIVSSVMKANKKKKESSGHPVEPYPVDDEDPWASIRKYFDNQDDSEDDVEEEVHPQTSVYNSIKSENIKNSQSKNVAGTISSRFPNDYTARSKRDAEDIQLETITDEDTMTGIGLDEDFDIRKAVIYSEIMKPKYLE